MTFNVNVENIWKGYLLTAAGVIVGVGQYLMTWGATMPSTFQEWMTFVMGLGVVVAGAVSKKKASPPALPILLPK